MNSIRYFSRTFAQYNKDFSQIFSKQIFHVNQMVNSGNSFTSSGYNNAFQMEQPRHIAEGEEGFPLLLPGSLRCYNMKYCPFAQRTLIVLLHKNVKFDIINIHLKKKPTWFLERSPLGKVPTLERSDGDTISESLVTMEYLDDEYQEPSILPKDHWKKAQDKMLVELFNAKVINKIHKFYYSAPNEEQTKSLATSLTEELDLLEKELGKRATEYFYGDAPGYVDFAMWPWFERFPVLRELFKVVILTERHPKLMTWMKSMETVPAVKDSIISDEDHIKFIESLMAGSPDYNMSTKNKL